MPDLSCNVNHQTAPTRGTAPQSRLQRSPSTWQIQYTVSSNWSLPGEGRTDHNLSSNNRKQEEEDGAVGTRTLSQEVSGLRYLTILDGSACSPFRCCHPRTDAHRRVLGINGDPHHHATVLFLALRRDSAGRRSKGHVGVGMMRAGARSRDFCSRTWRDGGDER
jgi:hypothetical protein